MQRPFGFIAASVGTLKVLGIFVSASAFAQNPPRLCNELHLQTRLEIEEKQRADPDFPPILCASQIPGAQDAVDRVTERIFATPIGRQWLRDLFACDLDSIQEHLGVSDQSARRIISTCAAIFNPPHPSCAVPQPEILTDALDFLSKRVSGKRTYLFTLKEFPKENVEAFTYGTKYTAFVMPDGKIDEKRLEKHIAHEIAMYSDSKWMLDRGFLWKTSKSFRTAYELDRRRPFPILEPSQSPGTNYEEVAFLMDPYEVFYASQNPILRASMAAIRATLIEGKVLEQLGRGDEVRSKPQYQWAKDAQNDPKACIQAIRNFNYFIAPPEGSPREVPIATQSLWTYSLRKDQRFDGYIFLESGEFAAEVIPPGEKVYAFNSEVDLEQVKQVIMKAAGKPKNPNGVFIYRLQFAPPTRKYIDRVTEKDLKTIESGRVIIQGKERSLCEFFAKPVLSGRGVAHSHGPTPRVGPN